MSLLNYDAYEMIEMKRLMTESLEDHMLKEIQLNLTLLCLCVKKQHLSELQVDRPYVQYQTRSSLLFLKYLDRRQQSFKATIKNSRPTKHIPHS